MKVEIDKKILDDRFGDSISYLVQGLAYSSNLTDSDLKPTYILVNGGIRDSRREYSKAVLLFMPENLFNNYLLKDRSVLDRIELLCLRDRFEKGCEEELIKYGLKIHL